MLCGSRAYFIAAILITLTNCVYYVWYLDKKIGMTREKQYAYGHINIHAMLQSPGHSVMPLLYLITPTKPRLEQKADLTRLSYTLRHVPRLHWIVIEDTTNRSDQITRLLMNCKIPYTHLCAKTPQGKDELDLYNLTNVPHKGVLPRNAGLDWLSTNAEFPSVLYFADDDNTYDLQIFEEMRYTKKIAVWPVGFLGQAKYESPAVKDGKVVGWISGYNPGREFACDMASFAVNTDFYMKAGQPKFNVTVHSTIETDFLKKFHISLDDLEPKADNCTKILAWHTRTQKSMISPKRTAALIKTRKKYSAPDLEV